MWSKGRKSQVNKLCYSHKDIFFYLIRCPDVNESFVWIKLKQKIWRAEILNTSLLLVRLRLCGGNLSLADLSASQYPWTMVRTRDSPILTDFFFVNCQQEEKNMRKSQKQTLLFILWYNAQKYHFWLNGFLSNCKHYSTIFY